MPASRDLPHKEKRIARRSAGDEHGTRQRDQELRRARGEIACIECQRLKLRCDRKVPCSSCIRRNKSAMCPNGNAWSDQETKTLLSDTAQLHRKLSEMSQRIRQLEDALEISHTSSSPSNSSHPLLREELLAIKRGIDVNTPTTTTRPREHEDPPTDDELEALGTLSISDQGYSRFIGQSGGGESLILLENTDKPAESKFVMDPVFAHRSAVGRDAWLFMPPSSNRDFIISVIETNLPSYERATSLCETYLECFSWICRAVQRDQIISELLPTIYKRKQNGEANGIKNHSSKTSSDLHDISLLLTIFAAGALADQTLPPYNEEAEHYYQLSLAAMSLTQVLGTPTLAAVQAITLMGCYNAQCGRHSTLDVSGSMINLACNLGINMGLHRDCARWNVEPKMVERRRFFFWELCTLDCWHNLANGKPPSFVLRYSDCRFPNDRTTASEGPQNAQDRGYFDFRHRFTRDVIYPIMELHNAVRPVKYSEILELDRRITECTPPPFLNIPPEGSSMEEDGPLLIMQRMLPPVCRDGLLMYIHRGFFAKAIIDHPDDPLASQYSRSYLSAYRSALSMLKVVREHYEAFPNLVSRFWTLWSHAFSAAVIIGSIVTRENNVNTCKSAMQELNNAVALFERAAKHSDRAERSLPILKRLQEKSQNAMKRFNGEKLDDSPVSEFNSTNVDELLIFGGKANFVPTRNSPSNTPSPKLATAEPLSLTGASQPTDTQTGASNVSNSSAEIDFFHSFSDQEGLISNYVSSGLDPGVAHTMALIQDPAAYMWSDVPYNNGHVDAGVLPSQDTSLPSPTGPSLGQSMQGHGFTSVDHHHSQLHNSSVNQAFAQPVQDTLVQGTYSQPRTVINGDTYSHRGAQHQWFPHFQV